jgi:hypothetical protein
LVFLTGIEALGKRRAAQRHVSRSALGLAAVGGRLHAQLGLGRDGANGQLLLPGPPAPLESRHAAHGGPRAGCVRRGRGVHSGLPRAPLQVVAAALDHDRHARSVAGLRLIDLCASLWGAHAGLGGASVRAEPGRAGHHRRHVARRE